MRDVIIACSGGLAVAIFATIVDLIKWMYSKKENKDSKSDAIAQAMKYVLYDRIRYLGQSYLRDGAIDFDDRRILNEMHSVYHVGLEGNGDLDLLMQEVNKLPLK